MQITSNERYSNYQADVIKISDCLGSLIEICDELKLENKKSDLILDKEKLTNRIFSVGIMGEFKRGKSTLINSLLGKEIIPADVIPTSATLNYIRWGTDPKATVFFKNGKSKEIDINELSNYVTKLTAESEKTAENVSNATVYYPCAFCQNNVEIIDTPGLNDDTRMTEISENIIPQMDAIIVVITPDSPFSSTEANFVRTKLMASDLGRVLFVLNKIDTVRSKEKREKLVNDIKERIRSNVLQKCEDIFAEQYGRNTEEFNDALNSVKNKISDIRLFPISAADALEGKIECDQELIENSGIFELENEISKLLTDERGIIELITPINAITSKCNEIREIIAIRKNALQLDINEFNNRQKEAEKKIELLRDKTKTQCLILKENAQDVYEDFVPYIGQKYDELEHNLLSFINNLDIQPDSIEDKAIENFSKKISSDVENKIKDFLSTETEYLLLKLKNRLGDDIEGTKSFVSEISTDLSAIKKTFLSDDTDWFSIGSSLLIFTPAANLIGAITGFKENNLKGALVGGGAGLLGMGIGAWLATSVVGGLLGFSGLALALPVALITGLSGSFGGKIAVQHIFSDEIKAKKTEKGSSEFKKHYMESIHSLIDNFRTEQTIEKWLKDNADAAYSNLSRELEAKLKDEFFSFEQNIKSLKREKMRKEEDIEREIEKSNSILKQIDHILNEIKPIKEKLQKKLNA